MNAQRVRQLADVVVVRRHAGDERVGADRLGGPLREVADHQRVVVRPRRLDEEPAQERLRRVGQLEELEDGQDPEQVAEDREACRPPRSPSRRRRRADAHHELERSRGCRASPSSANDRDDGALHHEDRDPGLEEDLEAVAAADGDDAGEAAEEDVRGRTRATSPLTVPAEDREHRP